LNREEEGRREKEGEEGEKEEGREGGRKGETSALHKYKQ